jgi:hypothetical protein
MWVKPLLAAGDRVTSYVAIRSDEDYREGYSAKAPQPDGEPALPRGGPLTRRACTTSWSRLAWVCRRYYDWRSRSGCTFCFFQQKIEWVRLKERHPEAFEEAKSYEKNALEHGSPFTGRRASPSTSWRSLLASFKSWPDYERRKQRELDSRRVNPLRPASIDGSEDIDDLFRRGRGGGDACVVCHK